MLRASSWLSLAIVFLGSTAAQAAYVIGVKATASSALAAVDPVSSVDYGFAASNQRFPNNITDGIGRNTLLTDGNPGDVEGMWLSSGSDANPWIKFDMGSSMMLNQVDVYNYNEIFDNGSFFFDGTGRGVATMDVSWSNDDVTYSLIGNSNVAIAPGVDAPAWGPSATIALGMTARYIRFDNMTNQDSGVYFGLNEVEFDVVTIPEPSTAALLGIGLMAIGWRRRY